MSSADFYTPPVLLTGRTPIERFADDLIVAGHETSEGLRWRPFHSRRAVEAELARRGFELVIDGADARLELRRFYAMRPAGDWLTLSRARLDAQAAHRSLVRDLAALALELRP